MSVLIGAGGSSFDSTLPGPGWPALGGNIDSLQPPDYRTTMPQSRVGRDRDVDVLWPRSSFPTAGFVNGFSGLDGAHQAWEWNAPPTGTHVRKKVTGVATDFNGNPLGGATVQLFNTATGLLVDTVVADSLGNYACADPNAVNCFAVAYLAGSPDVAGATVNTLVGT